MRRIILSFILILSVHAACWGQQPVLDSNQARSALSASIDGPSDIAYANGHLYVMEITGNRVWDIDLVRNTARLMLPPPKHPYSDDGTFDIPFAIAVSRRGEVYAGDVGGILGRIDEASHSVSVLRKNLLDPYPQIHAMTWDEHSGTVLLADRHKVLRWDPVSNGLEQLAGSDKGRPGFAGDGGPAGVALFQWPQGLAVDEQGNIFVSDTENCRVRKIESVHWTISTIFSGDCPPVENDTSEWKAQFFIPRALAVDSHGVLFISGGCLIRRIDTANVVTTYAGTGNCGDTGDGDQADRADIRADGLAVDDEGNVYFSDYRGNRIRKIDAHTHIISTIAGNGRPSRLGHT